jgi:hypothetical protein
MRSYLTLLGFGLLALVPATVAQDKKNADDKPPDTSAEDIRVLKDVGVPAEGPALLDYFRKRTFKDADPKKVALLIEQMGHEDFVTREKAYLHLIQIGPSALPAIKEASQNHPEPEGKKRALDLRSRIEAKQEPTVQIAAARMVARLKPAKAAEVILNYLPFADLTTMDEFCKALGAVAMSEGKTEPTVVEALKDKLTVKRAAAAEALLRANIANQKEAARALLKDPEPAVRLRTALALIPYRDRELVPVLVDVLQHLPPEQLWRAQEVLENLAGDDAPVVSLGDSEAGRKACHQAWAAWLKKNEKVDLAKLTEPTPMLGLTVIAYFNNRGLGGRQQMTQIMEIDRDKKVKWKFDSLLNCVDAQVVGDDRILVAEYNYAKITERNSKGAVQWEHNVGVNPIGVQRLANGNTFVVSQHLLLEFDKDKKQVYSYLRNTRDIYRAKKLKNGEVVLITINGLLVRLDAKNGNKELASFNVGRPNILFGGFDVMPNGNLLVPDTNQNRVAELTPDGKEVRKWTVQQPSAVVRLPNGNILVSSYNSQRVSELDRGGREVWAHAINDGMPFSARKR